jgi:hypothetical protein
MYETQYVFLLALPNKECFDYFKNICSTYERCRNEESQKSIEVCDDISSDIKFKNISLLLVNKSITIYKC